MLKQKLLAIMLAVSCVVSLTACGADAEQSDEAVLNENTIQESPADFPMELPAELNGQNTLEEILVAEFDENDLKETYTNAEVMDLSGCSEKAVISSGGTYELKGDLDGQLYIDAGDGVVHLILNNVNIKCDNSAAIYVKKAQKVIITLSDGTTNTLNDGTSYVYDDAENEEPNAALYSKADLTINGTGTLVVNSNFNNGIRSNDLLKLVNGNIFVTAVNNAITGKDGILIKDGNYSINAGNHGIKATKEEDDERGYLVIYGGTFDIKSEEDGLHAINDIYIKGGVINISAGDDGIHSDGNLVISDGNIKVDDSYEGLEGENVRINGGTICVTAEDDGINSAGGTDVTDGNRTKDSFRGGSDTHVYINDGIIYVNADGDGIDANGSIFMSGGNITVYGPVNAGNGAIDYEQGMSLTGGTLIAVGSSGMACAPTSTENQSFVMANVQGNAGSVISVSDESGKVLLTFTTEKSFSNVVISTAGIEEGKTYYITSDQGENVACTAGEGTAGMGGFGPGGHGGMGEFGPGERGDKGEFTPGENGSMGQFEPGNRGGEFGGQKDFNKN